MVTQTQATDRPRSRHQPAWQASCAGSSRNPLRLLHLCLRLECEPGQKRALVESHSGLLCPSGTAYTTPPPNTTTTPPYTAHYCGIMGPYAPIRSPIKPTVATQTSNLRAQPTGGTDAAGSDASKGNRGPPALPRFATASLTRTTAEGPWVTAPGEISPPPLDVGELSAAKPPLWPNRYFANT